jgi:hypothetical protein
MLEAVSLDLLATRSVVGMQLKAPFYALFEKMKTSSKVTIFDRNGKKKRVPVETRTRICGWWRWGSLGLHHTEINSPDPTRAEGLGGGVSVAFLDCFGCILFDLLVQVVLSGNMKD